MHRSKTHLIGSILLIALILGATSALAQPDPNNCRFPSHIALCPSGDITVTGIIRDSNGQPINWPINMVFSGPAINSLYHAPSYPFPQASATSISGVVTFNPQIGGCEMGGGVRYFDAITGVFLGQSNTINSPDLSGDGVVNLSDVVILSSTLYGPYNRCIDFNGDGVINLVDVSFFAAHMGH